MQYYGAFYRSALLPLLRRLNAYLMRWLRKKYKRLAPAKKAGACWERVTTQYPRLFAHCGADGLGGFWGWVEFDRSTTTGAITGDAQLTGCGHFRGGGGGAFMRT
jgi:hypothetical protein